MTAALLPRLRLLAGLLMAGEGALVVTGILDHEAPRLVGFLLLLFGLALAVVPALLRPARATSAPPSPTRSYVVAAIGLFALCGTLGYNLIARSTISTPELAIVLYGAALLACAPFVHFPRVGAAVAYSFPLLLAPLSMYAVNAAIASSLGAPPLAWYIRHTLAAPMAWLLSAMGVQAAMLGDTIAIATPRGGLFLTVGTVCAGLYAAAIFLGIFALFAWEAKTPPRRLAAYLALGLVGLHVANVVRLTLLGYVGYGWGGAALQSVHQHAGWVFFLVWTLAFWWLVLRRFEGPARAA